MERMSIALQLTATMDSPTTHRAGRRWPSLRTVQDKPTVCKYWSSWFNLGEFISMDQLLKLVAR